MKKKLARTCWATVAGGSVATLATFTYGVAAPLATSTGASRAEGRATRLTPARIIRYRSRDEVSMIAFARDGRTLMAQGRDFEAQRDTMRFWSVSTGRLERTLALAPSAEETGPVLFSPDQKTLARGGSDIELLDARTGKSKRLIKSRSQSPEFAFSPDGSSIVTGGDSGAGNLGSARLRFWDARTGRLERTLNGNGPIAFSERGNLLAASARNAPSTAPRTGVDDILLLDAASGRLLRTLPDQKGRGVFLTSLAFSRGGKYLAVSRDEAGTEVWDVKSGKLERTLPKSGQVAFSPGDRFLAIASDQNVTLWSPQSGALAHTLPGNYVAFSPNGAMAATGEGRTLHLWNIASHPR